MTIINTDTNACVVREKIAYYSINPNNSKELIIWLDGGQTIHCVYDSEEKAKENFDAFDKLMRDPLK